MRHASKNYIINTVYSTNILPVTSKCNTSCIFCSHKQNPPGIEVFHMPELTLDEIEEIIGYLSPERKIVIGESATRIIEGEPLLRRDIVDIITLIRSRFKSTPIQLTTNGILLDEDIIQKFIVLGGIELNISANCVEPLKRVKVLGRNKPGNITEKLQMLKGRIKYSGSCVLVPGILDYKDLEDIVAVLDENEADTVRVFLPGYAGGTEPGSNLLEMYKETVGFINKLKKKYSIPVVVEPSYISDLECKVEGVIKNTPAEKAGIKAGDIIVSVNNQVVCTRVEAFNKAYLLQNPILMVKRDREQKRIELVKEPNTSPGVVVLYDIDYDIINRVNKAVNFHKAERILFITSELALDIIQKVCESGSFPFDYSVIKAENRFFGGTIKCAGLLTVQDIVYAADRYLSNNTKPDLILLPPIMFDTHGRDLLRVSIKEVEKKLGVAVDTT